MIWAHVRRRPAAAASVLLLALVAGSVGGCAWREYRRRADLYWYDVSRDTTIEFPAGVSRHRLALVGNTFHWPIAQGACHSAMLRLSVRTTLASGWFEPAVRVSAPSVAAFDQYFERRARGARWINVSPLCPQAGAGTVVALQGRHVAWNSQDAEIVSFPPPAFGTGPLLVLAPHPDDAEIAAFGLYRSRLAYVVNVTAGDYPGRGFDHLASDPGRRAALRGRLRVWDSVAVPLWGGVAPERVANLGYLNGSLEEMAASRGVPAGQERGGGGAVRSYRAQASSPLLAGRVADSTWDSLVDDLVEILRYVAPSAIVAPHPLLDRSVEHRLTTVALLEAMARAGEPEAMLLLYTNHAVGTEYYPFGPADALVTLPPAPVPVTLPAVLSLPLDEEAVLDKLFALDAMHDLRAAPRRQLGAPGIRTLRNAARLVREFWADPHDYYSYFRRAVRPNELFVVIGPREVGALRADLARWRVAPDPRDAVPAAQPSTTTSAR